MTPLGSPLAVLLRQHRVAEIDGRAQLPVGARSFTTSGGGAPAVPPVWAEAAKVPASKMMAAQTSLCILVSSPFVGLVVSKMGVDKVAQSLR